MTIADAAHLLQVEYAEMPGLALTGEQAQRLCNLPREICRSALELLLETGFLKRTTTGIYLRRATGL